MGGQCSLPSTTPPFQTTKAPKEPSKARYGHSRVITKVELEIAAVAKLIAHRMQSTLIH